MKTNPDGEMILETPMILAIAMGEAIKEVEVEEDLVVVVEKASEEDLVEVVTTTEEVITIVAVHLDVDTEVVVVVTKKKKVIVTLLAMTVGVEIKVKPGELDQAHQVVMITQKVPIKKMEEEEDLVLVEVSAVISLIAGQVPTQLLKHTQTKMILQALGECEEADSEEVVEEAALMFLIQLTLLTRKLVQFT